MTAIFWFRRDLRLEDNTAFIQALKQYDRVIPLFIFDTNILDELPADDARVSFIYQQLESLHLQLKAKGSGLIVRNGKPVHVWRQLLKELQPQAVFYNKDYEPYALKREKKINELLQQNHVSVQNFKDQVIFEEDEIVKADGSNYTVFTPYKNKWLDKFKETGLPPVQETQWKHLAKLDEQFPELESFGFKASSIKVRGYDLSNLENYNKVRNLPGKDETSYLSVHLRFGTVSIREIVRKVYEKYPVFLSELIWREFFMQILYRYPRVVHENFKLKYNGIQWRNNEMEYERWCRGETGYPMVDAGMRQLNLTGYMHNRVRMITASFLCKHLLIDWRWGEAYFAKKLLDFELASNNGNWQWAAGTGCDAAPYFRVFNPAEQQKKFDKDLSYIKKWIPELDSFSYPPPMIDHKYARERALRTYKKGIIETD
ncbi:cryptochrome/photolyase family protein [Maribellus sediminis]|uniref:cryptochrome/photolyase family protein n=1 Tax=Maribellus sediminis TaxID=2696285 RepID=UPI001431DEA9|nr:deoxyribodipyrimidine photo-lyase [Maribellus sediminis]